MPRPFLTSDSRKRRDDAEASNDADEERRLEDPDIWVGVAVGVSLWPALDLLQSVRRALRWVLGVLGSAVRAEPLDRRGLRQAYGY